MKDIKPHIKTIVLLIFLHFIIDRIYTNIYPNVSIIRATLIGLTALLVLLVHFVRNFIGVTKIEGFLPIYSSAFLGALLVQAGFITSKTTESGLTHIGILAGMYTIIKLAKNKKQ